MAPFSLNDHLHDIDALLLHSDESRPIVALTTHYREPDATLRNSYYQQVAAAGGIPLLLPPLADKSLLTSYIQLIDALIVTGGGDCDPRWWGEERAEQCGEINATRDTQELLLLRLAQQYNIPILGICRGMQMIAVANGGKVNQDLSVDPLYQQEKGVQHTQQEARHVATHRILLRDGSLLQHLYNNATRLTVNSFHHQSIALPPQGLHAIAWADDGVVEAITADGDRPLLGVQWHPECLAEQGRPLFAWLVGEAGIYKRAKRLHKSIVTIDSHCDTPMFFPQGADFTRRDAKIKVDLCKMAEGRLDVATMAAYIPQPVGTQTWEEVMPLPTTSPYAYANLIFDHIEAAVQRSKHPVAIARNGREVLANKQHGRKSIMLVIENALALGSDKTTLQHFKRRGIVYVTLCHNGDNAVCDSAKKSVATWHGLSAYGAEVVEEMQRLGIMVDLSHASEETFYDVLALATRPVVCSHSNCKALCSSSRNLSDEQLRQLAQHDGVCQLTLYDGFVSDTPSEADILAFVAHLRHAARLMGIEHIGIGTDFDGDGGVRGLNDTSDMLLFTRQLLKNHFTDEQIRLIWGANWLRAIAANQDR